MDKRIFYSWQSDLPGAINRSFIQKALENAASLISSDDEIDVEPVVDRDTLGVAGAPDISTTIFGKISAADVFVADVSIINQVEGSRPTPNPNVLIELGYALKTLGHERIILVFNNAFGSVEQLPFDLRSRRVLTYSIDKNQEKKAPERVKLEKQLEAALRAALAGSPVSTQNPPAIEAIEQKQPNRVRILREELERILQEINRTEPQKHSEGGNVGQLIEAISSTQEIVFEFSKLVEAIALMEDLVAAKEIYTWFGKLIEQYDYAPGKDGRSSNADHDYFRFLGHEMFVTLIALLLREERWAILDTILHEPIPLRYQRYERGPVNISWTDISAHVYLLAHESSVRKRMSLRADILNERHEQGKLSDILPMEEFSSVDFLLFLIKEVEPQEYSEVSFDWVPWSSLYLNTTPMFIKKAQYKRYANNLIQMFNVPNINELKGRLKERYKSVTGLYRSGFWHFPSMEADIDVISSK